MEKIKQIIYYSSEKLKPIAEKCAGYIALASQTEPKITDKKTKNALLELTVDAKEVPCGYNISCIDGCYRVTGNNLAQTVRGAYAFLEKAYGINPITAKKICYKYPKQTIPKPLNNTYQPFFEYAHTDWLSAKDTEYSLFHGLNAAEYRDIPDEMGGSVGYIGGFCHTLSTLFCSADKYFAAHPEYFALRQNKRKPTQLCLTNPDVLKIVTEEVFDVLKQQHNPDLPLQILSLTQHDNIGFCTCKNCKAVDNKYGSHAGTMLCFVNDIAKKVKQSGYNNVAIDTFAYRYTRTPPKGIQPEENVIIRLCSIECCFSHPLDDAACRTNAAFMEDFAGWAKICKRIYIWDYCTNFSNFVGIFPNFGVLQRNMQIFAEHNVKGVYEEGNYMMTGEAEFGELRCYLISHLLQDPYCDYRALIREFTDAYYGEGAKAVREFLSLITARTDKLHLGIYQTMFGTLGLNRNQIRYCNALWEKAKNAATGEYRQNVLHSELCWRWWKMGNFTMEFSCPLTYKKEREKLLKDIKAAGVTRLAEVGAFRSFYVSVGQDLYFKAYPIVKFGLDRIYAAD